MRDFAITTWDVSPDKLQSFLPDGLTVQRFDFAPGRARAFVSAVTFFNTRFYAHFAPFVKLQCYQTNYRAYVQRGEKRCVWFFATMLASPFVLLPRHVWQLPWHHASVQHSSEWADDKLVSLDWKAHAPIDSFAPPAKLLSAQSEGATEQLSLVGTGKPLEKLPGFSSLEQTHDVLTHPLVGYLRRRDQRIATYGVWHPKLVLEQAIAHKARFALFEQLGLVEPDAPPHSVLVQRQTQFLVLLPPQRVEELK
jgi:hypothetical protein